MTNRHEPLPLPNRRSFILSIGAIGAAGALGSLASTPLLRRAYAGSADKLQVGCVGCGGMGGSDLHSVASHPKVKVAALCDINRDTLKKSREAYGVAESMCFTDYRAFLAAMGSSVDAVIVSTPDHAHAPVAVQAMRAGKGVYCQKPLTHNLHEARTMRETAAQMKVATQMGIQNHANKGRRLGMAWIESGILGPVKAVHIWTNRPAGWWPQGGPLKPGSDPVPADLDWESWINVAPMRSYLKDTYAPFRWRGVRDFGTGALGDMACHFFDAPTKALGLTAPVSIRGSVTDLTTDQYALSETVQLSFDGHASSGGKPFDLWWYDGGRLPPSEALPHVPADFDMPKRSSDGATIFVCEGGTLVICHPGDVHVFTGGPTPDFKAPDLPEINHWHEWVEACMGNGRTRAGFDFSGPMTEIVLCGVVGGVVPDTTIRWDSKSMTFDNAQAQQLVKSTYRSGWSVAGLG
ncbi:MAG: Gfo/Idh/MocA family oxidoreductase [Planctomycetota bacterium]|nr:Gfo/Idh/MocA family oxidoreductase [Planctomycetota bacterium]MDA1106235.1 Gfo/Idh/MocA family oxidoreductase [Planctomycetota bacterium]